MRLFQLLIGFDGCLMQRSIHILGTSTTMKHKILCALTKQASKPRKSGPVDESVINFTRFLFASHPAVSWICELKNVRKLEAIVPYILIRNVFLMHLHWRFAMRSMLCPP